MHTLYLGDQTLMYNKKAGKLVIPMRKTVHFSTPFVIFFETFISFLW